MEPDYRVFTLPKGKRRRKTKRDLTQTSIQKRLAMTLEARELGLSLTDYLEILDYEQPKTRMDKEGAELLKKSALCCEAQSQDDGQDD